MELDISSLMLISFIILFIISVWKVYAFLPNKQLADDDTTEESKTDLTNIILSIIKKSDGKLNVDESTKLKLMREAYELLSSLSRRTIQGKNPATMALAIAYYLIKKHGIANHNLELIARELNISIFTARDYVKKYLQQAISK